MENGYPAYCMQIDIVCGCDTGFRLDQLPSNKWKFMLVEHNCVLYRIISDATVVNLGKKGMIVLNAGWIIHWASDGEFNMITRIVYTEKGALELDFNYTDP
jgi:hypothetical protein